jgi:hypothetical protein
MIMCKFFSSISNGNGKVLFFKIDQIVKIMVDGNPENYDFNSHTSIAHFNGIKGAKEDNWNKWEYNVDTDTLEVDTLNTTDDRKKVLGAIKRYLKGKDIGYIRNIQNMNSGNGNSGDGNSGYRNSGDGNSGNRNSGNRNSGDGNSGNRNSGNRNSGDRNSGDGNSGYRNSGNMNSGNGNSGNRNSGNGNSGNRNSGDRNSGNRNSGDGNSGDGNSGNMNSGSYQNSFCTDKKFFLFDVEVSKKEYDGVYSLGIWRYFNVSEWIWDSNMTEDEKTANPTYKTTGGFVRKLNYKEAWSRVPQEAIDKIKKLKNFNSEKFKEITGLTVTV